MPPAAPQPLKERRPPQTTGVAGGSCLHTKSQAVLPLFRYGLATRRGGPCSIGDRQTRTICVTGSRNSRDHKSDAGASSRRSRGMRGGVSQTVTTPWASKLEVRRAAPVVDRWQVCRFLPPSAPCDAHHFGPLDIFNTRSKCNVGSA